VVPPRNLDDQIAACVDRWQLELGGERFTGATQAIVLPATFPDGSSAILKIQTPHRESEREADALSFWNGDGAVRLLERDDERHAVLIERCVPGTPLFELEPDSALDVMAVLLPRLWKPAGKPFRPLEEEAAWWTSYLPETWEAAGRPFEKTILESALDALRDLPASQGGRVLLHQDLHAGNVLRAEREPWLAIDPKPLVGEREFGIAALVRGDELGSGREQVRYRLTAELGLDRDRARLWTLAQTVAWAFEDGSVLDGHIEVARALVSE
jgi:streptomycin 6-kinase